MGNGGAWAAAGYEPTAMQWEAHAYPGRFKLVAGGERAGKSLFSAMELVDRMAEPEALYWIVGPDYEQAKAEFEYTLGALQKVGAVAGEPSMPMRGMCRLVTHWGAEVETKTSVDVKKLASKACHGIVMAEAGQQTYETWLKCRGRVSETRGWVLMCGTFEGSLGWYPEMWERWQGPNPERGKSFSLPTWGNSVIFPGGEADPEIAALRGTYPDDLFNERFGAVPCKPEGLVFKEFSHAVHVDEDCVFDSSLPVELAIDPGYRGAYAVLAVQVVDSYVMVVDEVYEAGAVASEVIELCKGREWWGNVRGGVIDIAGRQHPGLPSHIEVWLEEAGLFLRSNRVEIEDGIARMRTFLRDPWSLEPMLFFAPDLEGTFGEMRRYRYPKAQDGKPLREKPIDAHNHALKALSYWLYDVYGPTEREVREPELGEDPFAREAVPGLGTPDYAAKRLFGARYVEGGTEPQVQALTFR